MCGICGMYSYQKYTPVDQHVLQAMTDSMIHRGPDDEGLYCRGPIGLGMRRLSIIDLSGGHQPMSNEDNTIWTVFNGEIYNFQDLRKELETKNHIFRTRSDTEVILHAYEEWGTDAIARLNGMFGLAIWDSRKEELILARDPFGIKPLYYCDQGGMLLFGSEIKAILAAPSVPRIVNLASLDDFLTFTFVPSPYTLFEGIYKLPPGYLLCVTHQGVTLESYYQPPIGLQRRSEQDWLDELRAKIETAVQRQMVADVPVGVMLSGGTDSATVAAIMRQFSGQPVHSFTVGFGNNFSLDETAAAQRSAEILGTNHHQVVISSEEYARFLPQSIWHLEEPVATGSTLAFYWVCKLAREYVKVVLTGQGADEPFAGYGRHLGEYYSRWYRLLPGGVRKHIVSPLTDQLPRNEQLKRAASSLGIPDSLDRLAQVYTIFDPALKSQLYRNGMKDCHMRRSRDVIGRWQQDVQHMDGLSQMLYVDARFSLADNLLLYGDKMSMAASLEARVPFLDLELMQLVESMPPQFKIRGKTQKYLLKRAVTAWLPSEITKRKKIGFATPVDQWFAGDLHQFIEERLLAPGSACSHYFEPDAIRTLITDHTRRRHDYKRHLFSLLTFEIWHEQFIARVPATDWR